MNDIWTLDIITLEYYGEYLKELGSKSHLLVIESYLLKSMAFVNMNLCEKYKVTLFKVCFVFLISYLILIILRNHFWRCLLKKV